MTLSEGGMTAITREQRSERFNKTTGSLTGGNTHPDRCVCQGYDITSHKHYSEPPYSCARCGHEVYGGYMPMLVERIANLEKALKEIAEKGGAFTQYGGHIRTVALDALRSKP